VFASLNEAGFDIYLMLRPLERKLNVTALEPTEFYKMKYNLPRNEKPKEVVALTHPPIQLQYKAMLLWLPIQSAWK